MISTTKTTFEDIKSEIINHLASNDIFKSYNFKAPALNVLIDALAYTTQYLVTYANFSINECFLDSAQLRHNVVSRAKELGYIPHQCTTAKSKIRLTVDETKYKIDNTLDIPLDTQFSATSSNGKSYTFRTTAKAAWTKDATTNSWYADLDIVEGVFITDKFQSTSEEDRFYLSNSNVDINYLTVKVYENASDSEGDSYKLASSISDFGPNEKLFFLQEAYNGKIEIYFGDGVMSKALPENAYIVVRYIYTSGEEANNILSFSLYSNSDLIAYNSATLEETNILTSDVTVTLLEESHSGGSREDIESIRFNAPKFYQSQDRAVTTNDYNTLIVQKFGSWINSITSWGGEDNETIDFGNVYICIKPKYTEYLSDTQKEDITEYLKLKSLPCISVKFVEPKYVSLFISMDVDWDFYKTTNSSTIIENLIRQYVINFFNINSAKFNVTYKYSKFLNEIMELDPSLEGIVPVFTLQQKFLPEDYVKTYTFNFFNKIKKESVLIGPWYNSSDSYEYKIKDSFNGDLYYYRGNTAIGVVGSVDYNSGKITLDNFSFQENFYCSSITDYNVPVTIDTESLNLYTKMNYIIKLDQTQLKINMGD